MFISQEESKGRVKKILFFAVLFFFGSLNALSQTAGMTAGQQKRVIKRISELLPQEYLFPEKAGRVVRFLEQQRESGQYDSIRQHIRFARRVTADMQLISEDSHLRLQFTPANFREGSVESMRWRRRARDRYVNFGFQRIERLAGNIAYIKLQEFAKELSGRKVAESVMGSIRYADAVIIDLRDNNGGSPRMVRLIASYFFDERPVHLFNHVFRENEQKQEFWTLDDLKGHRMPDVPLYILINRLTFSAAEEFAYCLQRLGRATIVGERSGGGANVGSREYIDDNFDIFIPYGQVRDPFTGDNWDNRGIIPDIRTASEQALGTARILALRRLIRDDPGNPFIVQREWILEGLTGRQWQTPDSLSAIEFTGSFSEWTVIFREGKLMAGKLELPARELIAVGEDQFMLRGIESFRLRFERSKENMISGLTTSHADGRSEYFDKLSAAAK